MAMLNTPTNTPKNMRLKDVVRLTVRLRITVKNSVDSPIIRASVPAMDIRSFQISINTPFIFSILSLAYKGSVGLKDFPQLDPNSCA
jgi:hypothetical protein